MDSQKFLDKLEKLKKDHAKPELWRFLKLWMHEGKSKPEVAKIIRKKTDLKNPNDVTIVSRRLKTICEYFDIKVKGKGTHEAELVYLFRKYVPDFVNSNVCPDAVDSEILKIPQPQTNPHNIPTPESISIPELTTLEFIGRDRDLTNLTNLSRQAKIVLIKAGAGVGKSTLAREFLQTHFKKVIRIEMGLESGNVTPAEEKVSQILRKDFDEESSRDFGINLEILREKLADRANPIGVLIDNLEPALDENYCFREKLRGYGDLLRVLSDRDVFSFTLITSRRSLITTRAKVDEYSLEGLDITTWRQYFHDCENGVDSEALMQMRDAYSGNAKVMDILHGAIKNRFDGNIGAYWSRYKDALLANSELETLISVEMDWLRDNQPDAYELLCRMGCYRYQDVKTVPFEGLTCLLWDVSESRQSWVVDYLSKTSLIEAKEKYYLHPAIREAAKLRLEENLESYKETNRKAAEFWKTKLKEFKSSGENSYTRIPFEDYNDYFEAYYHYVSIEDFKEAGEVIVERVDSESLVGSLFYRSGNAQKVISAIEKIRDHIYDSSVKGRLFNLLGDHYWAVGDISTSIKKHEQSRKIAKDSIKKLEQEIPLKDKDINDFKKLEATAIFNIVLCKLWVWEIEEAIEEFNKVPRMEEYRENNFTEWETSQICLNFLSRFSQGDRILEHDIIDNDKRWHTALRLLIRGFTYKKSREFEKAKEYYNECIKWSDKYKFKQIKGKTLTALAELERSEAQDNCEIAISRLYEAIELLKRIGAKCDLAEAYFQLGITYQVMRENDQAEEYKAKALELFAQMEVPKQIERVNKAFGGNIQ